MEQVILKAEKLNKYFHEPATMQVLHDISLEIYKGEFVSIMGKSGCGKSTLLYLLSTLDTDYEGTVYIDNEKVTGLNENAMARFRNEHIGFVFQFHFLLPEFIALENVVLPALKLGRLNQQQAETAAMEKLKLVGLEGAAHNLSGKLSGGEQQRVAIARALINNPQLIMADEPTGNLDSANTAMVFDIFSKLAQQGNTIIVVTHDHDFAAKTTRHLEMSDGSLRSASN